MPVPRAHLAPPRHCQSQQGPGHCLCAKSTRRPPRSGQLRCCRCQLWQVERQDKSIQLSDTCKAALMKHNRLYMPKLNPAEHPWANSLLVTASAAVSALLATVVSARLVAPSTTSMARALGPGALREGCQRTLGVGWLLPALMYYLAQKQASQSWRGQWLGPTAHPAILHNRRRHNRLCFPTCCAR